MSQATLYTSNKAETKSISCHRCPGRVTQTAYGRTAWVFKPFHMEVRNDDITCRKITKRGIFVHRKVNLFRYRRSPANLELAGIRLRRTNERSSVMARKSFVFLAMGTVIFLLCSISSADVPHMINYQGKLTTTSGGCVNDTVQMAFSIYPDTTGSPADWTETQAQVVVKDGIFNVLLGSVVSIPASVFGGSTKYLGVKVGSDPEMTPLKPMVSVPYAYRAGTADGSGGGGGWVDDGTVVRLETSTDYVGIGTNNPQADLHIEGTTQIGGVATIETGQRIQAEENGGARILGEQGDTPSTPAIGFFSTNGIDDGGGGNGIYRPVANTMAFATLSQERMRISPGGNIGIGTTDQFGQGHGVLSLGNAADNPTTTLTNAALFYASGGEMYVYDAAGNATQISPHDKETGEWVFYSKNTKTGRIVRVDMERLVRKVEELTGEKFMIESWEDGE